MRNLNITFEDKDFKELLLAKQDYEKETEHGVTWEKFILLLIK